MDTSNVLASARLPSLHYRSVVVSCQDDPIAATRRCLARIDDSNARIAAMIHVDREGAFRDARASALRLDVGAPLSAIDGMPIAIKANIAVAGWPWTAGIAAYTDRRAERDASCVARLRAAGAILIGATNMDEGALGATTDNPWFGRTHNPHRQGFTAGGSSGGSAAAIAAGYAVAALGTDTIGSVRIPASYCGVVGHKPRRGAIAVDGVTPLSPTLDTVGVLARDVATCRAVTAIAAGASIAPVPTLQGLAFGVADWSAVTDDPAIGDMVASEAEALARGGGRVVALDFEAFPLARLQKLLLVIAEVEGAEVHRQRLGERPDGFSGAFAALLAWGAGPGVARYEAARRELETVAAAARRALAGIDAMVSPATPQTAFAFGQPVPPNQSLFATLASALGYPATVIPIGRSYEGLPIGVQIMAANDAPCLGIAEALMDQCGSSPPDTFIDSAVI